MGKIVVCMGKIQSGKGMIVNQLLEQNKFQLQKVVSSTTRPIGLGEVNGREYYFTTEEEMRFLEGKKQIIEKRKYGKEKNSVYYYTSSNHINLESHNYITITNLEGLDHYLEYYGEENIISLLIQFDDGERFQKLLTQEREKGNPNYKEMCQKFLLNSQEFSLENMKQRKITGTIMNTGDTEKAVEEVIKVLNLHL